MGPRRCCVQARLLHSLCTSPAPRLDMHGMQARATPLLRAHGGGMQMTIDAAKDYCERRSKRLYDDIQSISSVRAGAQRAHSVGQRPRGVRKACCGLGLVARRVHM